MKKVLTICLALLLAAGTMGGCCSVPGCGSVFRGRQLRSGIARTPGTRNPYLYVPLY